MGIDLNLAEWSIFFFRTLHIVTAIAWIGASFYFVWLDMNLRPVSGEKLGKGPLMSVLDYLMLVQRLLFARARIFFLEVDF